jgi:hypothetical protein
LTIVAVSFTVGGREAGNEIIIIIRGENGGTFSEYKVRLEEVVVD